MSWRDRVFAVKREHKRYANFEEFVKFVACKSDEANDPLYGMSSASPSSSGSTHTHRPRSTTSLNTVSSVKAHECVLCKGDHLLYKCDIFKALNYADRSDVVSKHDVCVNCLRKGHHVDMCTFKKFCHADGCKTKHSALLHRNTNAANYTVHDKDTDNVLMPIVCAMINNTIKINCLLDTGSTSSFVTKSLASKLNLPCSQVDLNLMTLNKTICKRSHVVDFSIESLNHDFDIDMHSIFVVDSIPGKPYNLDISTYSHLHGLDVIDRFDGHIDLLIGQDYADCFMPLDLLKGKKYEPYAVMTPLGYVVYGPNSNHTVGNSVISHSISTTQLDSDISKLWELDQSDVCSDTAMSVEDLNVKSLWDKKARFTDGRWEVPIPWKSEQVVLPNNISQAKARLMGLQKNLNNRSLYDIYDNEVSQLLSCGYAERAPDRCGEKAWYIPHHCVPKKNNKIRLVFDCASKYKGMSLNSQVFQGPDYINKLHFVLLRFRQHQYAISADIESMYNRVKVPVCDRDALRFLWFLDGIITQFQMTSHLFGGVWSSSSACYALRRSASACEPNVRESIENSFYVDDYLQSVDNIDNGVQLVGSVRDTLDSNGFRLTKFIANDQELLRSIPDDDKCSPPDDKVVPISESKILGVKWNINSDYIYFDIRVSESKIISRRHILSFVASIFDPLGLISPVIIAGKVIFQQTTRLKLSWDEQVPSEITHKWNAWLRTLLSLADIKIPRCVKPCRYNDSYLELHCFSDASEHSYGCCIYLRCVSKVGVHTSLIYAKHRLAPIKHVTIPRLELQAAVLSAKVSITVRAELEVPISSMYYWSDSMIVLCYIRNSTRRFKPFVANRLSTIHRLTAVVDWHHVCGSDNPADIVSRGCSPEGLDKVLWLDGPQFLKKYKSDWSMSEPPTCSLNQSDVELKKDVVVLLCEDKPVNPIDALCHHYSSWYRFKKAVAWFSRLKDVLLHRDVTIGSITVEELKHSEEIILSHVQAVSFSAEIASIVAGRSVSKCSKLYKLHPILNDSRLLVVHGRLTHADILQRHKYPVIVPYDHPIASQIVRDIHGSAHLGQEWVVSIVRNMFWITNIRNIVRRVSRDCVICKKRFSMPGHQQMADLPLSRVNPYHPPFFAIGLDCFGPYFVKYGRGTIKRYGCVFSCFTTRAVHIETIDSLETDSLINALRRFVARRGTPDSIFCDNGTNLTGACKELKSSLKCLSQDALHNHCLANDIRWNFVPPQASHMGGVYERMIRTIRKVFTGILNPNTRLTDEILQTVFCEVEGIINGRPITKVSTDVDDMAALTPNHLLLLRGDIKSAPGVFSQGNVYRKRWRHVQSLANLFWKRWLSSYIPDLQRRIKWHEKCRNLSIGDLVLICDVSAPRGSWPLGLIKEVNVSRDNLVRSARVKTARTELVRPVTKLVLLEGCDA